MTDMILTTIHGSHLYGLNHAESDEDWYFVTLEGKNKASHTVTEDLDMSTRSLPVFLRHVSHGVPQALEAAFSRHPTKEVDPRYAPYLDNLYAYGPEVFESYESLIHGLRQVPTFKRVRHSFRVGLNLDDIRKFGRFNPTLDEDQIAYVNEKAKEYLA